MIKAKIPAVALCRQFRVRRIAAIPKSIHGDIMTWIKDRYAVEDVVVSEPKSRDVSQTVSSSLTAIKNIVSRHGAEKSATDLLASQL